MAVQALVQPISTPAQRMASLTNLQVNLTKSPSIQTRADYWSHAENLLGPTTTKPAPSSGSQLIQVNDSPNNFGKGVIWDRSGEAIVLALFLNAADPLGVSISNVESTDYVTMVSADGIASFAQDKGNPLASSIIGIVGEGLAAIANLTGIGALATPLINDATQFAQNQFKPTYAKTKKRDAFGVDPGSGAVEREEGGILVTLPGAGGPYYSGDSDHKDRWIKAGGSRDDPHRPSHVVYGFFPVQNTKNARPAGANGDVFVTPWDYKFDDNAGYYKVFLVISKQPLP